MSDIRQLANTLRDFKQDLLSSRSERYLRCTEEAGVDPMTSRIANDRVDEKGVAFGQYSEETIRSKSKRNTEDNRKNPVLDSGFSSLDFPNVNFYDSNEMLDSIGARVESVSQDTVVVSVEPSAKQKVMESLVEQYGREIMAFSEKEEQAICQCIDDSIQPYLDRL